MEPSQQYYDAVANGTHFQETESAWAGADSKTVDTTVTKSNGPTCGEMFC